ncbi:MAG: transaldolase / glucose-6-phosphate isomerase [Solirubrobacteraceae bacterium]|nr:transaldolase / glucose-6-phosphate isomerase [Solirubrobacteraceae bacterium]
MTAATIDADLPPELEGAVAQRLERARSDDVIERIRAHDGTLWAPAGTPEVTDRLGWLDIADRMAAQLDDLTAFVEEVRADGYTDAVLLGMGGSSLAPEVFWKTFGAREGYLKLHVLDSTHPDQVRAVLDDVDLETTLFIVSSKSGGTIETLSQFKLFHARQPDGAHFVAVTDPGSGLADIAREHGFRRRFDGDPEIGGRYSALSMFGLVPAALIGADLPAVLDAARAVDPEEGLQLGCAIGELAKAGRDKLTFVVHDPLASFGLWVEQLIAESTGKQGRGILPIADEPLVEPSAYGDDRVFVHIGDHADPLPQWRAEGHPVLSIAAGAAADLGRLFVLWEWATAVAGWALEINPFDQPNVQEAKDNTKRVLDDGPPQLEPGDLGSLADRATPPHYVAIMAYVPYSSGYETRIARVREAVVSRAGTATTFGYGPRFLHSTGQLHKGGPKTGLFVQLFEPPQSDLEVPGEPFGLKTLISAQADGDLQTLRDHGLDAVRTTLDDLEKELS